MKLPTTLFINGEQLTPDTLNVWRRRQSGILAELACFLDEWYAPSPTVQLHTSGSTGEPACIHAPKSAMLASAELSCRIFGLRQGHTALLCLPLRYVAGKMMVVRALVSGLQLIVREPSSTPMDDVYTPIDFAAMVPLQASRTLAQEDGALRLGRIGTLLLGGGFIDPTLEAQLQPLPCRIFASYGMTETFSHIALRCVNGAEASTAYTPLPGVSISTDAEERLTLSAPHLGIRNLRTNDRAELQADGSFIILGRCDAVINSGGIKIQAEELENTLHAAVSGITTLALPAPHPELGECVALLWEGTAGAETSLRHACDTLLPRHHRPHHIIRVRMPRTESGKAARAECREMLPLLLASAKSSGRGLRHRIISSIEELRHSAWWEKACDPKVQAGITHSAELWLSRMSQRSRIARRLNDALQLLKSSKGDKKLASPRNIIILTAVILYTITPLDGIPDILPIIGWLDDLGLLALAVQTVRNFKK